MTKLADELEGMAKDAAPPPPEIHSLYAYMQARSKLIEFVLGNLATIIAALRQPDAVPGGLVERLKRWANDPDDEPPIILMQAGAAAITFLTAERDAALALVAELEAGFGDFIGSQLCGETWGLPDTETVTVDTTFGKLKQAHAPLEGSKP